MNQPSSQRSKLNLYICSFDPNEEFFAKQKRKCSSRLLGSIPDENGGGYILYFFPSGEALSLLHLREHEEVALFSFYCYFSPSPLLSVSLLSFRWPLGESALFGLYRKWERERSDFKLLCFPPLEMNTLQFAWAASLPLSLGPTRLHVILDPSRLPTFLVHCLWGVKSLARYPLALLFVLLTLRCLVFFCFIVDSNI